jgi:hypothetical protein
MFRQRGSTSRSHGVACHFTGEEEVESRDEEGTSRNCPGLRKPEGGRDWVDNVPGLDIIAEVKERLEVETGRRDHDLVSFEESVRLVTRQKELVKVVLDGDRVAPRHFLPIL